MRRSRSLEGLDVKYAAMADYYLTLSEKYFMEAMKYFSRLCGFGDEYHCCEFSETLDKNKFVVYYDWTSEHEISTTLSFDEYCYFLRKIANDYVLEHPEQHSEIEILMEKIESVFK